MRNIVLARIDDRLIHGQVVTAWLKVTNGNCIVIPDDKLPSDMLMNRVLKAAAPAGIEMHVLTVEDAANYLKEDPEDPNQKVVILGKYPETFERLMDAGVELDDIVLGGMVNNPQRKPFIKQCSATDEELACMKRIIDRGVHLHFQLVPGQVDIEVKDHLK